MDWRTLKKNKGFCILLTIFIILCIADLITTYLQTHLLSAIELNPLLKNTGVYFPLIFIFINALAILLILWAYLGKKAGVFGRYMTLNLMISIIFLRIIAVRNALSYVGNNVTVAELQAKITPEVVQAAQIQYAFLLYAPLVFCIIGFFFYWIDHKIERKDKK